VGKLLFTACTILGQVNNTIRGGGGKIGKRTKGEDESAQKQTRGLIIGMKKARSVRVGKGIKKSKKGR